MNLAVQIKNVYGNETIYPMCEKGKLLCSLAGTKTFTRSMIETCKKLGYEFHVMPASL